ncbi:hypothetical protein [Bradyrhizobium japonicum]|uniref:hypothetical protein n=1 Tax=Bradyrhizobium japonicum TaxID=375 RepID=UPI000462AB23|nr:hypothetical protein [Bradyrhizobium japonicum]
MPFLEEDQAIDLSRTIDVPKGFAVAPGAADLEEGSQKPSWNWGAAFRRNNEVAALAASNSYWIDNQAEPGFNPWDKIKGTADEVNFEALSEARNQRKFDAIRADIARETEDRKLLDSQPWWMGLVTEGAAGVLSPTSLIPGGSFVKGAKGGIALAKAGAVVGGANAVSAIIQEGALQSIEQTRTAAESATAIGSSLFLGGLLGVGGQALLSKGEWQRAVAALDQELQAPARAPSVTPEALLEAANSNAPLRAAGAAANTAAPIEENTIAGGAARMTAAATAQMNPLLRALHSPSAAYREIMLDTVENPLYLTKNFEGVASAPAVETLMKEYNGGLAKALQATNDAYLEHRKAGGQLARDEFREAVGKAMRRGDTDADPVVARVAQEYRANVFEPLKEQAIKAGLLPPDVSVDTAQSYFTRMWNSRKISADEQGFKGMVQDWVEQNQPKWAEQFDKAAERRLDPMHREISALEMEKVRRAEDLKQRADVADTSEMSEGDIRQALRIVQGGAPKPKGVKTLSQFVVEQGGLVDDAGELAHRGITNKARPGMIRKERRTAQGNGGGWTLDDMARHAWENGYFPEHSQRPGIDEFVEALNDDFSKTRAVLKRGDEDAYRLTELVAQLEADLARAGVGVDGKAPRFSTSEEMKGAVERVYKALDAEADRKIAVLKDKLNERQADIRVDRESRFLGDPKELARSIADEVFDTLTGRTGGGVRNDFLTIKARGPLKERTFNIADLFRASNGRAVEDYLEHDVEHVARRYTRVMGADVELARKFGSVDMVDQINKIRDDYRNLRAGITDEKQLKKLADREKADIRDLEAVRDMLRGTNPGAAVEANYSRIVRSVNHFNYLRSMGEVAIASLTETVRPAMVHGLMPYMETLGQTLTNLKGIRASVKEAQLAGVVTERVLGTRLATLSEIIDPYASRGPVEAFLENMTNIASKWNGIRLLTDMQKSIAAVMTQNRILRGSAQFAEVAEKERAYLAYLGIDQSMAERIARQFAEHGETVDKVRVANVESWTDEVAARTYRAALSKDVDSIITTKGVADTPLFANTPTGRAMLQFKSFALASHQRVLLRGLQEGQARFVGGLIAMTTIGMMATWMKAVSGNRTEKLQDIGKNPGWWISEGLDRSGIFAVPMELANTFEKATGFNPIKTPIKAADEGSAISQRMQNRSLIGSIVGPSAGLVDDTATVMGLPKKMIDGEEVTQAQKNAAERLLPFNSYLGLRQFLRYVVNPQT